jgi:hypothetical protein
MGDFSSPSTCLPANIREHVRKNPASHSNVDALEYYDWYRE